MNMVVLFAGGMALVLIDLVFTIFLRSKKALFVAILGLIIGIACMVISSDVLKAP